MLIDAHPRARITSRAVSVTVCLGQPVVELVCEGGVFRPRLGGAVTAAALARGAHGAQVMLAGAAGDDGWGRWLRTELADRGVPGLALVEDRQTPVVFVGRRVRAIYGEAITPDRGRARPDRGTRAMRGCTGRRDSNARWRWTSEPGRSSSTGR